MLNIFSKLIVLRQMPNAPICVTVTVKVRISTTHEFFFFLRVINVIETTFSNDIIRPAVNITTR